MKNQTEIFILFFVIAGFLSVIFTILARKISFKYNFYDDPKKDCLKIHKSQIPFLGGAAVLASFIFCVAVLWQFGRSENLNFESSKIIALFVGSIIAWFYGFWDDTYWQNRDKITQGDKIFLQLPIALTLALIFYNAGIKYQFLNFSLLEIFLSAFFFLFIENAVNLQDGLDGLAAGIILISSFAFFIFFIFSGNLFGAILAISILGAISSFLFFNWHPASVFMGNNGSYFLGFLMVVFAIMSSQPARPFYSLIPYLLLGAPILNAFYVFAKRAIKGRSLFSADREHIHDDFYRGVKSVPKAVLSVYAVHLIFVVAGLFFMIRLYQ